MITTNGDGLPLAKVRVRSARAPEKGTNSIRGRGQKSGWDDYTQEDLPWTVDIIMNPHSFSLLGRLLHEKERS